MKYAKLKQVLSLLTCLLMLLAVAIQQNRKVFGHDFKGGHDEKGRVQPVEQKDDGTFVVHTGMLAKDIIGYGGNTPVDISVKEGRIVRVTPLPNAESSEFFGRLKEEGLFSRWIGMTPEEAVKADVDAVSGATFSSTAVIATVRRGMQYVVDTGVKPEVSASRRVWTSPEFWCVALVILAGSVLPSFGRSPRYRVVQLVLNVVVLGFWSGSFISYSLMVNYLSNGLHGWTSVIPVLLLIVAFVFPLFGKKNHYCAWICPLGSLQELAGKTVKYKWRLGPRTLKSLNYFREGLWGVLMLLMWTGIYFRWTDYELFTAFFFRQASVAVIVAAVAFILLSCVCPRPYCRFVCPTGCLFRISQNSK